MRTLRPFKCEFGRLPFDRRRAPYMGRRRRSRRLGRRVAAVLVAALLLQFALYRLDSDRRDSTQPPAAAEEPAVPPETDPPPVSLESPPRPPEPPLRLLMTAELRTAAEQFQPLADQEFPETPPLPPGQLALSVSLEGGDAGVDQAPIRPPQEAPRETAAVASGLLQPSAR
jgi:hypothetical protein